MPEPQRSTSRTYLLDEYEDAVAVVAPLPVLDEVDSVVTPFFRAAAEADAEWTVRLAPDLEGDHPSLADSSAETLHAVEARQILVRPLTCNDSAISIVRVLRTMARTRLAQRGYLLVHGACVEVDGVGVILVGEKHAGKTVASLSLVKGGGDRAFHLSNDDAIVGRDAQGRLEALGTPRSTGVRRGTLTSEILDPQRVLGPTLRTTAGADPKMMIRSDQLAALGLRRKTRTEPRLIVILEACEGASTAMAVLAPSEGRDALRPFLESEVDRRRRSIVHAVGGGRVEVSTDPALLGGPGLDVIRITHPYTGWISGFARLVLEHLATMRTFGGVS